MGAAGYQLNKQINDTVAYKKAQRPSPSAVQGTGIGYDPKEEGPLSYKFLVLTIRLIFKA